MILKRPNLWIAFIALLSSPCSWAKTYKWVDRDQNVHYSQTPPPSDIQSIEIPDPPKPSSTWTLDQKRVDALINTEQRERTQEKKRQEQNQNTQLKSTIDQYNCQLAKKTLQSLIQHEHLMVKGAHQVRRPLTQEERQAELKHAQDAVNRYCD